MSKKSSLLFLYSLVLIVYLPIILKDSSLQKRRVSLQVKRVENYVKDNRNQVCLFDKCYAAELDDKLWHYLEHSRNTGIPKNLTTTKEITPYIEAGFLVKIEESEYFVLDTMYYSYPYLTPKAKLLLNEIGENFHRKLENTGLECTRFTITSLLRTSNSVKRLKRRNRNSVSNSSHLHGTTFDVSYRTFVGSKEISYAESLYLGDVLAKTIWELKQENKCWATYETRQTCYHVVAK